MLMKRLLVSNVIEIVKDILQLGISLAFEPLPFLIRLMLYCFQLL